MNPERERGRVPAREDPPASHRPGTVVRVGIDGWISPDSARALGGALHLLVLGSEDLDRPPLEARVPVAPVLVGAPLPRGSGILAVALGGESAAVVGGLASLVHEVWLARGQPAGTLEHAALDAARSAVRAEQVRALLGGRTFAEGSLLASLAEATALLSRRLPAAGASRVWVSVDTSTAQPDESAIHESADGLLGVDVQFGGSPGARLVLHVSAFPRCEPVEGLVVPVTVRALAEIGPCLAEAEVPVPASRWAFVALRLPAGAPAALVVSAGPLLRDSHSFSSP